MTARRLALGVGIVALAFSSAWGQAPPTSAKVDTEPLELKDPVRFQVPAILEPVRKVTLVATSDSIVRSQDAKVGMTVREGQEVAQFDRAEAAAHLKIAQAELKEKRADLAESKTVPGALDRLNARVEAAQARVELAQAEFERTTIRAPFAGKIMASFVSDGQYVTKGGVIAELADVSSLRALVPIPRMGAVVGGSAAVSVEGQSLLGKIQALVPLPESAVVLHELTTPMTGAWIVLPNIPSALEPGQRVLSAALPNAPMATIPAQALKKSEDKDKEAGMLQVIRNEYVTNVKVKILGTPRPDRIQVMGTLRPTDALIVSSSVPLLSGTLIRFNSSSGEFAQGSSPHPAESGASADVTPPRVGTRGTAPIGAPGSAVPRVKNAVRSTAPNANQPPVNRDAAGAPPF